MKKGEEGIGEGGGCSAGGGQEVTIGKDIRFLNPQGTRGDTPKLRMPDLSVRARFIQHLLDQGAIKEWPPFIDVDGESQYPRTVRENDSHV